MFVCDANSDESMNAVCKRVCVNIFMLRVRDAYLRIAYCTHAKFSIRLCAVCLCVIGGVVIYDVRL